MAKFPSRFRRLDQILADLPVDEPMLLTELDGYLTGIALCPDLTLPSEWLPPIWGGSAGESVPFDDPFDRQQFADMVGARHHEILRDLDRHKFQPIFDIDERNGEVIWEDWALGFATATELRPDEWSAIAAGNNAKAASACGYLLTLASIAADRSALTSVEINTICDEAALAIPVQVLELYAAQERHAEVTKPDMRSAKIGRNEACPCGSGKKHKRCCGSN